MLAIRNILHPTDFSGPSDYAFHVACELARAQGATLHLLHVAKRPVIAPVPVCAPPEAECYEEELTEKLRNMRTADIAVAMEPHLLFSEAPADAILRVAKQIGADLIVMGTHGRTGLNRLLMGSVAEHVVRRASCPVLSVKAAVPECANEEALLAVKG